jgi:hypothetical protein
MKIITLFNLIMIRIKKILRLAKAPIKQSRTAYVAICSASSVSFEDAFDKAWKGEIVFLDHDIPKTPYIKVRIEIVEINRKYDTER